MTDLHEKLADAHPSLKRGMVWCKKCRNERRVDSANAMRHGWPTCCGETMTIDHPDTWKENADGRNNADDG